MRGKRGPLIALAATLLLGAATATAVAATQNPVPPDQYVVPEWVPAEKKSEYLDGYRGDYDALMQAEKTGSRAKVKDDQEGPALLFVAPEDRDEAVARVKKGEDVPFVQRADGQWAISR